MSLDQNRKIVVGILTVSLLASIVYFISSCGCNKKKDKKESFVKEYTGLSNMSSYLYRPYSLTEDEKKNTQDRCKFCKGYNNYSFEAFENKNNTSEFKLCPHNAREYGVSLCNNQGKIM